MAFKIVQANPGSGGESFVMAEYTVDGGPATGAASAIIFGPEGSEPTLVTTVDRFPVAAAQNGIWNVVISSGTISLPTGAATDALQTAGNASLASIDLKIPALGQALAAASVPVVLTAAQLTTLTPPAAIVGFATEGKQDTIIGHVDGIETLLSTIDADTSVLALVDYATQATLATRLADATFTGRIGEVQASPTANTVLDRLKTLATLLGGTLTVGTHAVTGPLTNAELRATPVPVSGTVTTGGLTDAELRATPVPVSGTVTANAGTNLNTSALALESGGNLAAIATSLNILDDWDESDRAKVNLIVGQAGITGGAGAVAANTPRTTLASDDPAVTLLGTIDADTSTLAATDFMLGTDFSNVLGAASLLSDLNTGVGTELKLAVGLLRAEGSGSILVGSGAPLPVSDSVLANNFATVALGPQQDNLTNTSTAWRTASLGYVFDGTAWDRMRGDSTDGLLVNLGSNNDVTGTVTANAGTDLNTSLLALEDGGNLAAALTALQLIDDCVYTDSAVWTNDASKHALVGGLYQNTPQTLTDGRVGPLQLSAIGHLLVDVMDGPWLEFLGEINQAFAVCGSDEYINEATRGAVVSAIRHDADTTLVNVDNQMAPLIVDARGFLKVEVFSGETMPVSLASLPALPAGTNTIGKVDHSTTGIGHGKKTVTAAGTDEALASSTACKWVIVQAYHSNTGYIAVGGTGVDAAAGGDGVYLSPGQSATIMTDNLADVFIDSTVNGEGVRFTYGV